VPWFTDDGHISAQARRVGVPSPEVLGVEQVYHDREFLSFSIQRLVLGRSLDGLAGELPASDLERLVMDAGELLAWVHSIVSDRGIRHELQPPDELFIGRLARVVDQALGPAAVAVVKRDADLLRKEVMTHLAPRLSIAHGDWLPKHLLIDDGAIVGVIDWEFACSAAPAFDIALWEVSACVPCTTAPTVALRVCACQRSPTRPMPAGCQRSPSTGRSRSARLEKPPLRRRRSAGA